MQTPPLYDELLNFTHAHVDHFGEAHIDCPECGHPVKPNQTHCSFSERGWYCFVCGASGSLEALARLLGLGERTYIPQATHPNPKPLTVPPWRLHSESWLEKYQLHPRRFELWSHYKPLALQTIVDHRLGVGRLPASRCSHDRLIVPVFWGMTLVGLRGRRIDCDCPAKWLPAVGTPLEILPLYNAQALGKRQVVFIMENPVDALLLTQEKAPWVGLSIYSTSYWKQDWVGEIKAADPEMVIIALDNDLVGNGGAAQRDVFAAEWKRTHNDRLPKPRGVFIANQLNAAGIPATLFDWGVAPNKADIGDLLMREAFI